MKRPSFIYIYIYIYIYNIYKYIYIYIYIAHVGFAEQHAAGEGEDDVLRSGEGGCQGFASVY